MLFLKSLHPWLVEAIFIFSLYWDGLYNKIFNRLNWSLILIHNQCIWVFDLVLSYTLGIFRAPFSDTRKYCLQQFMQFRLPPNLDKTIGKKNQSTI